MKSQDRYELAKHRKLKAINDQLAQHERKSQLTLLLVVVLNVVLLAVLAYQILSYG